MSTQTNAAPGSQAFATPAMPPSRGPFYWSIRRELWENRSIYLAPLIVTGVSLVVFALSLFRLPHRMREVVGSDFAEQSERITQPYSFVAVLLIFTGIVVGIFYTLDALQGERRDRSILFWKSLPVSDQTTVLAKISIPLLVIPLVVFVNILALQYVMAILSTLVLLPSGLAPMLWRNLSLFQLQTVLLYGLMVHSLWQAPLFAWLLFVSAWSRRMAFLWALSPFLLVAIVSGMIFRNPNVHGILMYAFFGGCMRAFNFHAHSEFPSGSIVTPWHLFASPLLYLNLA